jgi:bis(5'-nucleosyl)-tetraphosphatase (symmetrical)
MITRTFVVGDVHGCVDELKELLALAQFEPGLDRLIIAGDIVDRGPDTPGTVAFLHGINAEIVLGNHDEKMFRYLDYQERIRNGTFTKANPMREPEPRRLAEWEAITEEQLLWMKGFSYWMRLTIAGKRWIIVHGGLETAGKPVEEQDPKKLCRVRYLLNNGRMAHVARPGEVQQGKLWSEMWDGEENVICGHAVHSLTDIRVDRNSRGGTVYSIDTGSCFGGRLSALELDSLGNVKVHQVQSRAEYAKLPMNPYE